MKVQLGTRVDGDLRQRLRVFAATSGRTVEDVVAKALERYLPTPPDPIRADGSEPRDTVLADQPAPAWTG